MVTFGTSFIKVSFIDSQGHSFNVHHFVYKDSLKVKLSL